MRIQFSTDTLPEHERVSYWHEAVCQQNFQVTPTWDKLDTKFRAQADVHVVGRYILADLQTSHGSIEKTANDLSHGASDSVLVYLALESGQHYQVGRDEYAMVPGDVCIVPMDRRSHGAAGSIAFRSLLIPNAVLAPLMAGRELTRAHHLKADAPLGILLAASLNAAASQIPLLTDELGDAVLTNLSGLVGLAIGTSDEGHMAGRDAVRVARLHLVKQHIGKHLANPSTAGRSVADVAFGWGFNSLSVFYRAFALAFGVPPGSVRAATVAGKGLS